MSKKLTITTGQLADLLEKARREGRLETAGGTYTEDQVIAEVRRVAEVVATACGSDLSKVRRILQTEADGYQKHRDRQREEAASSIAGANGNFNAALKRIEADRNLAHTAAKQLLQKADEAELEMCRRMDIVDLLQLENTPGGENAEI